MASKRPKTVYMTSRENARFAARSTAYVGRGRRTAGFILGAIATQPGRVHPGVRIAAGVAGAGLYAHGKYAQLKARKNVRQSVQMHGMKIHTYKTSKSGALTPARSFHAKVDDARAAKQRAALGQQKQNRIQRPNSYKGTAKQRGKGMSRSQAASIAAKARWGRR